MIMTFESGRSYEEDDELSGEHFTDVDDEALAAEAAALAQAMPPEDYQRVLGRIDETTIALSAAVEVPDAEIASYAGAESKTSRLGWAAKVEIALDEPTESAAPVADAEAHADEGKGQVQITEVAGTAPIENDLVEQPAAAPALKETAEKPAPVTPEAPVVGITAATPPREPKAEAAEEVAETETETPGAAVVAPAEEAPEITNETPENYGGWQRGYWPAPPNLKLPSSGGEAGDDNPQQGGGSGQQPPGSGNPPTGGEGADDGGDEGDEEQNKPQETVEPIDPTTVQNLKIALNHAMLFGSAQPESWVLSQLDRIKAGESAWERQQAAEQKQPAATTEVETTQPDIPVIREDDIYTAREAVDAMAEVLQTARQRQFPGPVVVRMLEYIDKGTIGIGIKDQITSREAARLMVHLAKRAKNGHVSERTAEVGMHLLMEMAGMPLPEEEQTPEE